MHNNNNNDSFILTVSLQISFKISTMHIFEGVDDDTSHDETFLVIAPSSRRRSSGNPKGVTIGHEVRQGMLQLLQRCDTLRHKEMDAKTVVARSATSSTMCRLLILLLRPKEGTTATGWP